MERRTQADSPTREAREEELAHVARRLKELPTEEWRLVEGYRKGFYAAILMREEMERLQCEQASAEDRRKELDRELARLDKAISYRGQVEELARRLSQGLDAMDFHQRRELLRLLVEEVVYEDGKATIRTILPLEPPRLYPVPQGVRGRGTHSHPNPLPSRERGFWAKPPVWLSILRHAAL